MISLDKHEVQLEIGDDVMFAEKAYVIQDIVLDPKQDTYCTAELAVGIRAYCFNMEKIT